MAKTRLGIVFGAQSVEHEVSVITAVQLMKQANPQTYELVPIYISKDGQWFSDSRLTDLSFFNALDSISKRLGDSLKPEDLLHQIDVAIICCHGTQGEDGSLQGLLDLLHIPYQSSGVLGSALCMDKISTKNTLIGNHIPVTKHIWFRAGEWKEEKQAVMQRISELRYPLYVKPSNMGSSVGISKAKTPQELEDAIQIALAFDDRLLVEESVEDCIEVNVSVLGFQTYRISSTEQPIKSGELLSYADKYSRSGGKKSGMASLNRRIPAPISSSLSKKIQDYALLAAHALDCAGVVRMDFLADPSSDTCWLNEVNSIPGSLSFYLWEASGMTFSELVDELVRIAQEKQALSQTKIRSIQTPILF